MAKDTTENPIRLRGWIILVFVLVVMGLLIADIGGNVQDILDRNRELTPASNSSPSKTTP
jgi:hypothetical protein